MTGLSKIGHTDSFLTMLIEIRQSIIKEAIKHKGQRQNVSLDLLFQMAICAKKGFHVVWVPCLEADKPLRKELSELITEANVNALCSAGAMHNQEVGWLKNNVTVKVILSYKKEVVENNSIIVNPFLESHLQPYTELFLLVENILDADFYDVVLKVYRKENNLNSCECVYYPLMGGGGTTAKVMENEVKLRKHFCLAIVDSDKHCPKGSKGQTCKDVQKSLVGAPRFCNAYEMNEVTEIENLIPQRVVRELYPLQSGEIDVFSKDVSFYDMKCGLRLSMLVDNKDYDYWKGLFPERQTYFNQRAALKKANKKKEAFETAIKQNDCQILPGFSANLLKRVLDAEPESMMNIQQENIKAKVLLMKTDYSHLSLAQRKEWENIGRELFSWSCGMKAN